MLSIDKKIYILCVANLRSGGPEALHQLRYYMDKAGLDAYIVYFNTTAGVNPMPPVYCTYGIKSKLLSEIEDHKGNILLTAESSTIMLNGFKNIQKYIWWLSVNWFDYKLATTYQIMKLNIRNLLGYKKQILSYNDFKLKDCTHLCGSKYAFEYVTSLGIGTPHYLVEPISKEFLEADINSDYVRNDEVLYNPAKPSEIMSKLLEDNAFKFKPLMNMVPAQLIESYKKAKLYIDFGHFGGPERMPKEAVYFGATILVNYRNAALNDFDIAIPLKYKVKEYNDLEQVKLMIKSMLDNYDANINDFEFFREKIKNLESNFMKQIEAIFYQS